MRRTEKECNLLPQNRQIADVKPHFCPTCQKSIPAEAPGGLCPICLLRAAGEAASPQGTAPSAEEIASAFPKLEILGLLGQGGMGYVYKARQPDLDRVVALKILRPELGTDPAFAERFAREARVLAKLNHPNIVNVFEHGQSGRFFYLLMEYVDGVNLRQAMRAGRFTPEQALDIVPGICDALQAAHAQGIWHRDIKPENILLDQDGRVKIVDFGIARIVGDPARDFTLTLTGAALGSAPYMAPEQHERPHEVDHRADIYSLGVVFYEMLTGELPLGRFPIPSERAAVHARIDAIVLQTLEKERELRQQSATEVKTDIQRAARDGGNSAAEPAPAPSRAESWFSGLPSLVRRSLAAWLGGLLLLGVGFGLEETRISGAAFPLAVGALAACLGLLGCLWSLFEMRRGWLPPIGRGLLTWTTLVPLLLALAFGGAAAVTALSVEVGLPIFLVIPVAFAVTFLMAWPLRHFLHAGVEKSRGLWVAACLLVLSAVLAGKSLQGKWPFIDARMEEITLANHRDGEFGGSEMLDNLRKAAGEPGRNFTSLSKLGGNGLKVSWLSVPDERSSSFRQSMLARLNQLSDPTKDSYRVDEERIHSSHYDRVFARAAAVLSGLSAFAALLLAAGRLRPGLWMGGGVAVVVALAALTPDWVPDSEKIRPLPAMQRLPLFTPEELPREVDFSSPEACARTIMLAAHRGQKDILREAVTPGLADKLDKDKGWELFSRPGKAVDPKRINVPLTRELERAFRNRSGMGDAYTLLDGKWKMDTPAYNNWRGPSPVPPRLRPPIPDEPEKPVVVVPKEDPLAIVRALNRLANEQNAEAFMAKKYTRYLSAFGSDIPAAQRMAPYYGEILKIGQLPVNHAAKADVIAKFKRHDGKEEYRKFDLRLEEVEWRWMNDSPPQYRAWTLVEFKPPQGNAAAIMKNHLGDKPFHPVAGTDHFLIGGDGFDGEEAKQDANHRHERLEESLKQAGLNSFLKVLVPATVPSEPWMGGEPEIPEIPATLP